VNKAKRSNRLVLLSMLVLLIPLALTVYATVNQEPAGPPMLRIFLFDACGGCGVGDTGCGECLEYIRVHLNVRNQLGERFNDGSVLFSMYNTRNLANEDIRLEVAAAHGVPDELAGIRPTFFIGDETGGLFMAGDEMLSYVGIMLERYLSGEAVESIQEDVLGMMNAG